MSSLQELCYPQQIPFHPAVGWLVLVTVWDGSKAVWAVMNWTEPGQAALAGASPVMWWHQHDTSPETAQTCSEEAANRTQPTAWSRCFLPRFLLLLLAVQMVSPAAKGTFTAFWRKQRESVLEVDRKCWSCYSPIICQQTVVGWMICWRLNLMILDVFSNLSDSVIGTPITALYFKLPAPNLFSFISSPDIYSHVSQQYQGKLLINISLF